MPDFDLLNAVQPDEGWFCVVGIKDGKVKQSFHETRAELDTATQRLLRNKYDVYFGLAKYKEPTNRTKNNVAGLKALWLDIDCGPSKGAVNEKTGKPQGYLDKETGAKALHAFCVSNGIPLPILVDSGRGLHAYWSLTTEITREEWETVAEALRKKCVENDLYVDPAVFEVARILRIPGTLNFKDTPPTEVSVLMEAEPISLEDFRGKLGVKTTAVALLSTERRALSPLMELMRDNEISLFSKIMQREPGCNQLKHCYINRATLPEPLWFAALGVAKKCEDANEAIHKLSGGHPDYDPGTVEQKIRHIVGPTTCKFFEQLNPSGCDGCPHKGKFGSPIALGRELACPSSEAGGSGGGIRGEGGEYAGGEEDEESENYIPEYPPPFIKGNNGAIYIQNKQVLYKNGEEKSAADIEVVYEYPLYVVKRMRDPDVGNVIVLKLRLPKDGIKQFIVPTRCIANKEALCGELAMHDILCDDGKFLRLRQFIILSIKNLQCEKKAENMRMQFGWADNFSKIIVGDREISKDGTFHSPPSAATSDLSPLMIPMGTLEKWKEVFNLYGRESLEPHAFGALTAFGSPLFGFLGQSGALINLINSESGQGKSTIQFMCNSVYGHPKKLSLVGKDTVNTIIHKMGVFGTLPVTFDEMTNMRPLDLSDLIYSVSQGRGKDRMKMSSNELRKNFARWTLIGLSSSNSSFYDKLNVLKNNPDGEMMRLVEYHVGLTSAIDPVFGKEMFDHQLFDNYGHAGDIYSKWLVNNLDYAKSEVMRMQSLIDAELRLTQRERFWSAVLAANLTGGLFAKRLGLLDWDLKRIFEWAKDLIRDIRKDVAPPTHSSVTVIADFVSRNLQNTLVVNDAVDCRTNMPMLPTVEPKGDLVIRSEPDTNRMYIAAKPFRIDCTKGQISFKETMVNLDKEGALLKGPDGKFTQSKRMTKGMKITGVPAVEVIVIDTNHPDFAPLAKMVDVSIVAEAEEAKP